MKKLNIFLAALLVLSSCTNEIDYGPGITPITEGEVTIRMQVPGHKRPVVYGASEDDENKITELDVLAFAKKTSTVDTLAYRIKVDASSISDAGSAVHGNEKEINVKLKRSDSDLKIVLIANARSVIDNASVNNGDELTDIFSRLNYDFSGKWATSPMTGIPMWGQTADYVSIKNPGVTNPVDITLLRSVAKIDVGVDVYGDPTIGFGKRFKLNHIYVYNANNQGTIIPNLADPGLNDNKVTKPHLPDNVLAINSPQEYTVPANASKFYNEIYLPESDKANAEHTFLVIGGVYDGGNETFYRIDFVKNNDDKLDLLRNYRFLVNITNVARDGFATKDDAANAKTSHIEYSLSVFNEHINSIVYDGQYGLGVSTDKVNLDWEASSGHSLTVATDYPLGFTASTSESWIQITSNPTGILNGNIVYRVDQNTHEGLFRTGTITIKAGTLVQEVVIRQYLGANSVVMAPNGSKQLSVLFANADGKERVTTGTFLSAEVLWQDATGVVANAIINGSGKNATLAINAGGTQGNAIVAIKQGGITLWSWHIWVTSFNPDLATSQKSYNGAEFMTRNLGAITETPNAAGTLGLLYQWGRKDPFPGASITTGNTQKTIVDGSGFPTSITLANVTVASNFDNSVKNPMTFYYSDEYPWYNWYGLEEVNNSLWVDVKGNKTAYDPCPQGWRVPASPKVWAGLNLNSWSNGAVLSSVGYYPAAGGLDFSNGNLVDVGNDGYYWTAEPSGVNAKAMRITSSEISVNASPLRASAYSVRCVRE